MKGKQVNNSVISGKGFNKAEDDEEGRGRLSLKQSMLSSPLAQEPLHDHDVRTTVPTVVSPLPAVGEYQIQI